MEFDDGCLPVVGRSKYPPMSDELIIELVVICCCCCCWTAIDIDTLFVLLLILLLTVTFAFGPIIAFWPIGLWGGRALFIVRSFTMVRSDVRTNSDECPALFTPEHRRKTIVQFVRNICMVILKIDFCFKMSNKIYFFLSNERHCFHYRDIFFSNSNVQKENKY